MFGELAGQSSWGGGGSGTNTEDQAREERAAPSRSFHDEQQDRVPQQGWGSAFRGLQSHWVSEVGVSALLA